MTNSRDTHDAWFRAKVQEALDDTRPGVPHEIVEADAAERRAAALRNITSGARKPDEGKS
jgi:DNA-damage-inducible protein J